MYIRRTLTRTLASGAQYYSHRLVRSERIGGRVRQVTLLNLGSDFALGSTQWQALCSRIEDLLAGHVVPAATADPPLVEVEAQRVAALLLARQSRAAPRGEERALESVDLGTLELTGARSVGLEQVALWAIGELQLTAQLHRVGMAQRHSAAALGLILGRMVATGSARATHAWWCERSALGELLGVDFQAFAPMVLERAAEGLLTHRKALEAHLFARVNDLFGRAPAQPLYYLTNARLEGTPGADVMAQPRSLGVTLGLVLDQRGFIERSASFAAAVRAGKPLKRMLEGLGAPSGALVAIAPDAASLAWLSANGYRERCPDQTERGAEGVLTDLDSVFASFRPGWLGAADCDDEQCDAADLFISVLACQCVQVIRRRLMANGIHADWPTLRQRLAGQCRVTVSVRRGDGRALHVRQPTRADCDQLAIFHALGIDPTPGGVQKTIV